MVARVFVDENVFLAEKERERRMKSMIYVGEGN